MPVVLAPDEEAEWLADSTGDFLDPCDGGLRAYPVSGRSTTPRTTRPLSSRSSNGNLDGPTLANGTPPGNV